MRCWIKGIRLAESCIGRSQIVAIHGGHAAQVQLRYLLTHILCAPEMLPQQLCILFRHLRHGPAPPAAVSGHHGRSIRLGGNCRSS
jgi:hypothetical protein